MPTGVYDRSKLKPLKHSQETKELLRKYALEQFKNGMPKETREKISKAHKGKNKSESEKEAIRARMMGNNNGRGVRSIETRRKMSASAKKGANSNFWRGGVAEENKRLRMSSEFRLWRESVYARDNWTCQECGRVGGRLHPHHVKRFSEYPELRFDVDNGITLCEDCHKETPTYGNKQG